MKPPLNRNVLAGNWKQLKGKVKEKWGKLTDDDLDVIEGRWEQLAGKIQAPPAASAARGASTPLVSAQVVQALVGLGWSERVASEALESVVGDAGDADRGTRPSARAARASVERRLTCEERRPSSRRAARVPARRTELRSGCRRTWSCHHLVRS